MKSDYNDTKAVAHLPNLDIEILHRRPWAGNEELLSITLRATPSFEAFFQFLESANPFAIWTRAIETAWAPWLRVTNPAPTQQQATRLPLDG
jgi:hypothetical protein